MIKQPLLTVLLIMASLPANGGPAGDMAGPDFILLRHAEKAAGVPDPELTPVGRARADFYASWLTQSATNIGAVWSSDFHRTRATAEPIAERLGVALRLYDASDLPALVTRLREEGVNAVVVGHSNTTPQLASLLCACETALISEDNYERGFRVSLDNGSASVDELDFRLIWTRRAVPPP